MEILVVEGRKKNVILDIALNKYKITDNISMRSKKKKCGREMSRKLRDKDKLKCYYSTTRLFNPI